MSNEIQTTAGPGQVLYATVWSNTGLVYNTSTLALEAFNAGNWALYAVPLAEQGASGHYLGSMPSVAQGVYNLDIRLRLGGSPAQSDQPIGSGEIDWSGTAEILPGAGGGTVNANVVSYGAGLDPASQVPAGLIAGHLTTARADRLDNLDAAVSSISSGGGGGSGGGNTVVFGAAPASFNTIVTRPMLAAAFNNDKIATDPYAAGYFDNMFQVVQSEIASFLNYDPVLQQHQGEEGLATMITSGPYQGRYNMSLKGQPLVPGPARVIFQSLFVTYALAFQGQSAVSLDYTTVFHHISEIYTLAVGTVEALGGIAFGLGYIPSLVATGYVADYYAGFATGVADPVPSGGGSGFAATATVLQGRIAAVTVTSHGTGYTNAPILAVTDISGSGALLQPVLNAGQIGSVLVNLPGSNYTAPTIGVSVAPSFNAPPLPPIFRDAAMMLCRERLAFDIAFNKDPGNPYAGFLSSLRRGSRGVTFQRVSPLRKTPVQMGYGGLLAAAAQDKLEKKRKKTPMAMIV